MSWRVLQGDALERLRGLASGSVQCCITSPPFYGLRDYGTGEWEGGDADCSHQQGRPGAGRADGRVDERWQRNRDGVGAMGGDCRRCGARRTDRQLGLESTPDEYVARLVEAFREVRRVLRADGTLWLNVGDSYASSPPGTKRPGASASSTLHGIESERYKQTLDAGAGTKRDTSRLPGIKAKDLLGIPWLLAFALRADGWYLRSDIIWAKPNPMPESVTDRPTSAYEHVFLLAKSRTYHYDADAIREDSSGSTVQRWGDGAISRIDNGARYQGLNVSGGMGQGTFGISASGRNRRNVWEIATQPFPSAHFATFPTKLVEPCVLAGSSPKACGECGAPWKRVVERYDTGQRQKMTDGWDTGEGGHGTIHRNGRQRGEAGVPVMAARTTGWQPSCSHDDHTGRCVVLDPFAGSGTVGVVARWHGRDFIGTELNAEYVGMAERRIASEGVLGRRARRDHRDDGHPSLFDDGEGLVLGADPP